MKTSWKKILDLDFYTEGPVLDEGGNLYFTALTGGEILTLDSRGEVKPWAKTTCPNGQRILKNGIHLVCESKARKIRRFDPEGNPLEDLVSEKCGEVPVSAPNDLAVDEEYGIYFTDSARYTGKVFFAGWNGKRSLVAENLDYPNGIAIGNDGKKLFVAESYTNRILVIELSEPGRSKRKPEIFCDLPLNPDPLDLNRMSFTANLPDGIAFDNKDRLWVAHYGMGALQVVGQDGLWMQSVPTGIPATSNLCFSPDCQTIYVTGGSGEPGPGMVHQVFIEQEPQNP